MRPGVEIVSREQPLPRSAPTDTGVWFVVGDTASGPSEATLISSLTQYETVFGARSGAGVALYDAVETYFREGGSRLWVAKAAAGGEVAALDKFPATLGPGQVSVPGKSTATVHGALLDHAKAMNRIALLDGAATGAASVQQAFATALKADTEARYGGLFAPYARVPGIAPGTTRDVPMSAVVAGIIARNDLIYTANQAAAGDLGQSRFATDLTAVYTAAEYESLNTGGVNMARMIYGGVTNYGFRSLVDPTTPAAAWLELNWGRLAMEISAGSGAIGEHYVFAQLDGRRHKIAAFGAELAGFLLPFWQEGALYGMTSDEAFRVDVGVNVNTEESIAAGELHAVMEVRMSPFAELVRIEIVKVATTQALAA